MDEMHDLTKGSILGKLTRFFFPILFGMLFFQLYNTVDAIVVGRCLGPAALAAVGGSPAVITNLVIGFFTGLGTGATVVISQYYGAHDDRALSRAVHTILCFCMFAGLLLSGLGWLSAAWSLRLVKTPADILEDSAAYLRLYYLGATGMLIFNIGSGILRAVGDSRWPLVFLGVCCVLNIALDLLFVAVLPWGVAGAAWATVISLTFSAVLLLVHLGRQQGPWRFRVKELRIYPVSLRRILYLGVPAAVQGSMYSLSNIIIQAAVNNFGTVTVAAWTALGKFDALYWVTSNAMGTALCTFVGQNFGAGQYERMRRGVKQWLLTDIAVTAAMSVILLSLSPWMLRMFSADAEVIALARKMMWYFAPFYVVWVFIDILSNALRGAGDSFWPMVISLMGVCLLRVLWIVLVVPHWNTIAGVSFSYPFTWGVTALTYLIYYLKAPWLERCTRAARGHAHE